MCLAALLAGLHRLHVDGLAFFDWLGVGVFSGFLNHGVILLSFVRGYHEAAGAATGRVLGLAGAATSGALPFFTESHI